jgi:hypothetical protein
MVTYNTYLDKENRTRCILRDDITEKKGLMTITLTILAHLVQKHEEKIFLVMEYPLHTLKYYQKLYMIMVTVIVLYR